MNRRKFLSIIPPATILAMLPLNAQILFLSAYSENELMGKEKPELFGNGFQLRKEASEAFEAMKNEAVKAGISIQVVSSYRSFQHQKRIWERKYKAYIAKGLSPKETIENIIAYSTIPGTSRHHWGTDIDIIDANAISPRSVLEEVNFATNGPYYHLKQWMKTHGEEFGFYEVYTNSKTRKGFNYEPWHFSYAPTAVPMFKAYHKLNLHEILKNSSISGSRYFSNQFLKTYISENITGINPKLIPC